MKHILLLTTLSTLLSCAKDSSKESTLGTDTGEPIGCEISFGSQPTTRLPVGTTLWLPVENEACGDLDWSVDELTADQGFLQQDEPRFVALKEGTWTLQENNSGNTYEITAIGPESIPFHNLMYQPNHSLVSVGEEVWIAEAYAPRIARFNATSGEQTGTIAVGPWPVSLGEAPALGMMVVAQAGNDTIGLIDIDSEQLVDSIWVGDEPVGVIVDEATSTAYVALETEDAIAVVDLSEGAVAKRLEAPRGPRAMGLTEDGSTLFVAGHRTGQPTRYPYAEDEFSQIDVLAIDTDSGESVWAIQEAGNIITDIAVDEPQGKLWLLTTVAYPERGLITLESPPFETQIQEYNLADGAWLRTTTIAPAEEGAGFVLGGQSLVLQEDVIWVAAQDSEVLVSFDAQSMEETSRTHLDGGPRALLPVDGRVWVHASQGYQVHQVNPSGDSSTTNIEDDPRPASIVEGHGHYIRPGESYGQNFSCNSCHYDGRGDTQVWRAGPFETWELSRPMLWLEGTTPLGWGAYVSDNRAFGYTGFASIIAVWPTTEMAENLGSFLATFAPPPKANGHTQRDGQLSDEAQAGKELYEGSAGCAGCHGGALTTNNKTFEEGITEDRSSTPTLVGAYRHNAWLKDGSARTLREAIVAAAEWSGVTSLTDTEVDALERYMQELTDRDFFVLRKHPASSDVEIGVDEHITLTFNQAVWSGSDNLNRFQLLDADGMPVDADVELDNRTVTLIPNSNLDRASTYEVVVQAGLESFDERKTEDEIRFTVETAAGPGLWFQGRYELTVHLPAFDFAADGLSPDTTLEIINSFVAETATSGSTISMELNDDLTWDTTAIISGSQFTIPPLPIKAANSLAQGSTIRAEAEDVDGDGIIDQASGTFIVSGPGFYAEDVEWEIAPETVSEGCVLGAEGAVPVTVETEDGDILIDWGDAEGLGLYVTTYGASLPLGPGAVVSDGDAFWALSTTSFPQGFVGPVFYGEVPDLAFDDSETHGAVVGGAELIEGECYQFSIITTAFQTGSFTIQL